MAMPDIGLAPPPPPDVAAQLKPSAPPGGGMDIMSLLSGLTGGASPQLNPDLTPKILDVEPMLDQIARQVPALGPDVDRLNVELKARMGGLPQALAGLAGQVPGVAPGGMGTPQSPPIGGGPPMPSGLGPVPPPAGPPLAPAVAPGMGPQAPPALPPNPMADMGAMDTAMQLEVKLPPIGQDDPTLMPYIQGFIARMREEVPKVVEGDTEAVSPPVQAAPTESMLSKIPVTY